VISRDPDPHRQILVLRRKQRIAHDDREPPGKPLPEPPS
jgi:hypothetical protein